ncbi:MULTISPECIES: methyltransferase [unclassified Bifidobacterium]|uniref:class I SAM-dependent methyltransferase n=1 Tax=unclassified Bifidobacterium TaxID=2608897 RepID=UPI0023F6781E|nr:MULTISPECIES: methyltransferase [unclassified Bifidobacterium]WEV66242.1 methyltransferase [Bifidobacterium sp. ESL0764]WEV74972.1 methyltransferase [Bifidobacterium sp. ESL0800]
MGENSTEKTRPNQARQASGHANKARKAEQYFSAQPSSRDVRRNLHVSLRGHEVDVEVSNGVFSGHRLDLGTSVLLRHAPQPPESGTFLDIGCGWGPIALAMGLGSPKADIWALDVNERALELTKANAEKLGLGKRIHAAKAEDIPANLTFDLIWSNPPIRVGKDELHTLLMAWLPRLSTNGYAYLVVQKNLGSDSLIKWLSTELGDDFLVTKYASSKGYRVIEVRH